MIKRIFDLLFVFLLSPIILFLFIVVLIFSVGFNRNNIFFIQDRGGYKEKKIQVIKFRTMEIKTKKISKFNTFLRRTRLDEIPQFFNVLKGDLSIVGPRPLHYEYKKLYTINQKRRFNVKPGLTGLAQIKNSYSMSWSDQFELDVWYSENHNFYLDLKIIVKTLFYIIVSLGKTEIKDKSKFNGLN